MLHCEGCSLDADDPVSQACCNTTAAAGSAGDDVQEKVELTQSKRRMCENGAAPEEGYEGGKSAAGLHLRLVQELEGHTDRVWGLAWSPCVGEGSKSLLASCSGDKTVRIWQHAAASPSAAGSWFQDSGLWLPSSFT